MEKNTQKNAEVGKNETKKFAMINIIGCIAFMMFTIIAYLLVSFATKDWSRSWLVIMGGVSLLVVYLLALSIKKTTALRRAYHPLARLSLALAVMMLTAFFYLSALMGMHMPKSWLIWAGGVICIFIADAIYAHITKQKLMVINYLIYIPAVAAMVYLILGVLGIVAWHPGWLIMLFAVLADLVIALCRLLNEQKKVPDEEENTKEKIDE